MLSIADRLAKEGSTITDVSLPHFKHGVASYNILMCAEVTSNMAKYSGLLFGTSLFFLPLANSLMVTIGIIMIIFYHH